MVLAERAFAWGRDDRFPRYLSLAAVIFRALHAANDLFAPSFTRLFEADADRGSHSPTPGRATAQAVPHERSSLAAPPLT